MMHLMTPLRLGIINIKQTRAVNLERSFGVFTRQHDTNKKSILGKHLRGISLSIEYNQSADSAPTPSVLNESFEIAEKFRDSDVWNQASCVGQCQSR